MSSNITDPTLLSADVVEDVWYVQQFAVPFEFPVVFTEDIFRPTNTTLLDAMRQSEAVVLIVFGDCAHGVLPLLLGLAGGVMAYSQR